MYFENAEQRGAIIYIRKFNLSHLCSMVLMITVCKMLMIKMFYIFSDVKKINIYPWICHLSVLPTSSPGSCTHVPPSELPGLIYIPDLAQTEQTNHHKLYINCRFSYLLNLSFLYAICHTQKVPVKIHICT